MSAIERAPRRAGFTEGRWITGADGSRWCLPVLDESSWGRFPSLGRFYALADSHPGDDGPPPALSIEQAAAVYEATANILLELLAANYEADPLSLSRAMFRPDETPDYGALRPVFSTLEDASEILGRHHVAESSGMTVEEVGYFATVRGTSETVLGWCDHDGIMFDN